MYKRKSVSHSVVSDFLWPVDCSLPGFSVHGILQARFNSVQLLCCVQLFATPWSAACQASLSITNSQNLLKLVSIESVISSNHLILCRPLLFPSSIFPSIRVFSNESFLCIRWPEYWLFSFSISPSNEYSELISFKINWFDLLAIQGTLKIFPNTTVQKYHFFSPQPSLWSNSHIHTWLLKEPQLWLLSAWTFGPLSTEWYLCFLICCVGLS